MAKKKKEKTSCMDQVMIGFCIFSGLLCLVCCVPKVPYRYAQMWAGFSSRFGMERYYSLYGASDNLGSIVSWMSLRSETCNVMRNNNIVNPLMSGLVMAASKSSGAGGAIAGCAYWLMCKENLNLRCQQYSTIMCVGLCALIFNVIGAVALFMVPMMVNAEKEFTGKSKKKKKKLVEAATLTLQTVAAGFVFPLMSYGMYMLATDSMFKTLNKRSAYPYGYASAGAFMSGGVVALTGFSLLIALRRWSKTGVEKEENDDDEDDGDGDGVDAMTGDPGFIDPASLGPAGAPPGMGPPGM